jgi:transposase-like protein
MDGARTTERRRGQVWGEQEARQALAELARSGESLADFARRRGISVQRVYYWKKRVAAAAAPSFVVVPVTAAATRQIEIVADGVTIRVREDLDTERLAEVIDLLVRRGRRC